MPYQRNAELPASVKNHLPRHAQDIYRKAFNNAHEEYASRGIDAREETAHRVAWSAVKKKYAKGNDGDWHER